MSDDKWDEIGTRFGHLLPFVRGDDERRAALYPHQQRWNDPFPSATDDEGALSTLHIETYRGDQWVKVEVEMLGSERVRHIIDGETVLQFEKPQIAALTGFDPTVEKDGMLLSEGYIALQAEGQPVEFRNIQMQFTRPHGAQSAELTGPTTSIVTILSVCLTAAR